MTIEQQVKEIFNGINTPDTTYIAQEDGKYEKRLRQGIANGNLCLLTGSSKTGKTTLYRKILKELNKNPLVIRCSANLNTNDFWAMALENIDFERITTQQNETVDTANGEIKLGGELGWKFLAGLIGEAKLGIEKQDSDLKVREKVLGKPGSQHLIPILKKTSLFLVVEDFHYLTEQTQQEVFQQWKAFVDEGVPVLVVGTTHHSSDLANANRDLVGRIKKIDLPRWSEQNLQEIAEKGFLALGYNLNQRLNRVIRVIAKEAVGLPIIVQQVCAKLLLENAFDASGKMDFGIDFSKDMALEALHQVASDEYDQFDEIYKVFIYGSRRRGRKYETYKIILMIFMADPLVFELPHYEIMKRISNLKLNKEEKPPVQSVDQTLNHLASFQSKKQLNLLEWKKYNKTLYVIEPSFLFYLRWKENRKAPPSFTDLVKEFLLNINELKIPNLQISETVSTNM